MINTRDKLIELLTRKLDEIYGESPATPLIALQIAGDLLVEGMLSGEIAEDNNVLSKWVPVSERLPGETGEYNVMIKGATRATSPWYSRFSNGWYNVDDDYKEPYDDVTNRVPSPAAPKEGE